MEVNMIKIGERLKNRRLELRLTQTDIFEKTGITSGVLSRIENGKNIPSVIAFYKLAETLNSDVTWLITGVSANMQNFQICKKEEILLKGFRSLQEDEQDELLDILDIKLRKAKRAKSSHSKDEMLA